ncbi:MAG TPA: DUF308 domain-containing protein [Candidatus Saccharibacteria bacterium]|jgi:uncharacterized membrane protein HdeD (DUF308 family)|nr:DUF308 domain-containing protein [Candidatus Saccharibacteria bacterium]
MNAEKRALETNWWGLTIRGIAAILFGIAAVFWPHLTLTTLVILFSAWVLIDGIVRIVSGLVGIGNQRHWFLTLVMGLVELGVGVYLIRHQSITFATLILLIAFTLIIVGVIEVVTAFTILATVTSKTLSVIWGLAATLAGIALLFQPESAGVAFVWILGLYALIAGPVLIATSVDARRLLDETAGRKK